jgi:hypothetical protein
MRRKGVLKVVLALNVLLCLLISAAPMHARIPVDPAILDIRRDLLPGATVIDVPGSWIKLSKLLSKD